MEKVNLYYFPYAGASSVTYKAWINSFEDVNFIVLDYPGHGKRSEEPLVSSTEEICRDLFKRIAERQNMSERYYFAGHCLGALAAYEICRRIGKEAGMNPPARLFLSGHGAPDRVVHEGLYKMSDDELIEYQRKVKGIPEELLEEDYIDYVRAIVLPPIRSDSEVYEGFAIDPGDGIVSVPLTVINGLKDWKSPQDEVKRWDGFTDSSVDYVNFDEDHYFLNTRTDEYLKVIKDAIRQDSV